MRHDSVALTIHVPASLADEDAAERASLLFLIDAVRRERLTWRAAAEAAGVAPERFLDLAREHGVPVVRYEALDMREDLSTLSKIERARSAGA